MRYSYVVAWTMTDGVSLPEGSEPVELSRSEHCRFILTREPDSLLAILDRGGALGYLMLKGLIGQGSSANPDAALELEIDKIREERAKLVGRQAVLVFEGSGDIDVSLREPLGELDGFIVTFDAIDKSTVTRAHRGDIDAMKVALAFEGQSPAKFALLTQGVYLRDERDRTVYSLTFSGGSAEFSVSVGLTDEISSRISARYVALQAAYGLENVERLFAQMTDRESDKLKAFISGWAALEILIAKLFKTYEEVFLSPLANAGQPTLRERFLQRLKDVMKDKYRLTDKFLAVAAVLFPDSDDASVENDYQQFSSLKAMRDKILHGEEFSERDLPADELARLLRKYILAHVLTPNPPLNVDARRMGGARGDRNA